MSKKYINGIQKVISFDSWKIIAGSKGYCRNIKQEDQIPSLEVVKEVLSELTGNTPDSFEERDMYILLTEAAKDIFDENTIKKIMYEDIEALIKNQSIMSYKIFCELLIRRFRNLKVRHTFNNELIDLYLIEDENKQLLSIDEANNIWLNPNEKIY